MSEDAFTPESGVLACVRGVVTSALLAEPAASMGVGLVERREGVGGMSPDVCCATKRADLRGDLTLGFAVAPAASMGVGLLRPAEVGEELIVKKIRREW